MESQSAPLSDLSGRTQSNSTAAADTKSVSEAPWLHSLWLDLAIASVVGLLYALIVMGPGPLNPRNTNWLTFDPAYHYIGWELFRQDTKLHWPLTYTDRLGYPAGESVAFLDLNPLLAVALKPLSPSLPEPCQYFGLEVIFACILQFFFALRLFRLVLGPNILGRALSSAFFLLSPPLNFRFMGHYSLSNHWLLVAALLVFLQAQLDSGRSIRKFITLAAILVAVSVGVNPYIALQVVLVMAAAVAGLLWQRRLTFPRAVGTIALLGLDAFLMAYALGFFFGGGRGYARGGYRYYSMNLLSIVDPRDWRSIIFHKLSGASGGQYEGYSYLGAGVLALVLIVVVSALFNGRKLPRPNPRWAVPLLLCCLLLTFMALSTKVTIGSRTLVDLDPTGRVSAYLAPLRASGRFFWTPYYVILATVLAAFYRLFTRKWANLLIAGVLVLQVADTSALRREVHTAVNKQHSSPLKSPVWSKLGSIHKNLIVLPAWQCGAGESPGGLQGYRTFGFLAVQQEMRINSYQSARYAGIAGELNCGIQPIFAVQEWPLLPDSAYVVTPAVAAIIAQGPTGPGKCHDLDGFILCSTKSDFGLSSVLMSPEARLQKAMADSEREDYASPLMPLQDLGDRNSPTKGDHPKTGH
jgi:Family of unknown function (DUF6311)